jgi:peptide/nickel transport system permease protein
LSTVTVDRPAARERADLSTYLRFVRRIGTRILVAIPVLVVVTFAVFMMTSLGPGNPAAALAGDNPTPERIAQITAELGLDKPLLPRYGSWLASAVHGDLGSSWVTQETVTGTILAHATVTASLVIVALIMAMIIGASAGTLAALRPGGVIDRLVTAASSLAVAVPAFLFALIFVLVFAVKVEWFPPLGYVPLSQGFVPYFEHLVLPCLALAALPAGELALQLKESMLRVFQLDYVLSARARGLSFASIVFKHSMRNALIPVLNVLGFRVAALIGGTVTVEFVFSLQGIGTLAVNSVFDRDVPVLLGIVVLSTIVVLATNLLVDLVSLVLNPRLQS